MPPSADRRPRWIVARVAGPSMVPTLRHGDLVLARSHDVVVPGQIVLARFRSVPGRLVVKRAQRREADGWWLVSDNAFAGGDSQVHGIADVVARVRWVLRRGWLPRRLDAQPPPGR